MASIAAEEAYLPLIYNPHCFEAILISLDGYTYGTLYINLYSNVYI